ncbi:GNAT family N-acetyltransferase [Pseudolysinimonas kribbensis]|nr:GNAT family N-acetyltransferase [Pseudolysinimonas kribbensis]
MRPTHRRQGLLRRMMEQSLRSSADAGVPLSILTASEGGIYERFGFGAAVWRGPLRLDVRSGLRLRASGRGSVHEVDPHWLMDRAPTVFERFHTRSFGSVSRRAEFLGDVLFEPTGDRLSALVRAAVHLGENGEVDGFAFYRPSTAWAHSSRSSTSSP